MSPEPMAPGSVATLHALRELWPDLRNVTLFGLDLRDEDLDWAAANLDRTMLLGCRLRADASELLASRGAVMFPDIPGLPFSGVPRRALHLRGVDRRSTTRIGAWFESSSTTPTTLVVRASHDATIDAAVARFVRGRRIVGVMGGHALERDDRLYRRVAELGRAVDPVGSVRRDRRRARGDGGRQPRRLVRAVPRRRRSTTRSSLLTATASYAEHPEGYFRERVGGARRWPDGGDSLGVPTWVYVDEPTTGFATHIAKYFTNSIREDGLLAIARSGVVYAPGGAGTEQEIFTDTAQNSLTLYEVRSPVVLFGRRLLRGRTAGARRPRCGGKPTSSGGRELVAVCDEPDEVVAFIEAHDPDAAGTRASTAGAGIATADMAPPRRPRARRRSPLPRRVRRASAASSTVPAAFPGRGRRRSRGGRAARAGLAARRRARRTRRRCATSPSSRSIRPGSRISTRRSMPNGGRTASASATRSPTSSRSSRPGARSTASRSHAA